MALNLYAGRPGSGKSYSVVEYVVIPALSKGRHVVTNIPLESELLTQVFGGRITQLPLDALDDETLPDLFPPGAVCIIDECWNRWPSGQKVSAAKKQDLHWLKEHRHRVDTEGNAMQVVLITQDAADIASWVRKLIAHTFVMQKLEELGSSKRFSIKVYKGCPTGERIPKNLLIRDAFGVYKPDIYQYYSSATQSETTSVGDEKAMDTRFNLWKSGSMITIVLFVLLAIPTGLYLLNDYFSMADKASAKQGTPRPAGQRLQAPELAPLPANALLQATAAPTISPVSSDPVASPMWRVVGYIKRKDSDAKTGATQWESRSGYQLEDGQSSAKNWQDSQAILKSLAGMRTVPLSACKPYANSVHYYCDLDGERVTPWSGQQGLSAQVGDAPLTAARTAVSSERSEERTAAHDKPNNTNGI
jgi:zona occludens toxin